MRTLTDLPLVFLMNFRIKLQYNQIFNIINTLEIKWKTLEVSTLSFYQLLNVYIKIGVDKNVVD